jgi:quinol monooxygenase YgiN
MIHVIAEIQVVEGRREDFLVEFFQIVPLVRAEQGCLEYTPLTDVDTDIVAQSPLRADTVTVVEKWDSVDALKAHLAADHMSAYREAVKGLVSGVKLCVLQPA